MRFATVARDAACDAVVNLIDAGNPTSAGKLELYSGPVPSTPNTAIGGSNTKLGTLRFAAPAAFGDSGAAGGNATGLAVANSLVSATNVVGGVDVGWFRVLDGNDVIIFDGTIKQTGDAGAADIEIDDKRLVTGGTVSVNSLTVSIPIKCP